MFLDSLRIYNFRNIDETQFNFSSNLNLFIGKNGVGKTNNLEAIYYTLVGESFRYGKNNDFIKKNEIIASLNSEINFENYKSKLSCSITAHKKNFLFNNKKTTSLEMKKKFSPVLFSPESLSYIKEGPNFRRVLLEELLYNIRRQNYDLILEFNKALKYRNKTLKDGLLEKTKKTESLLESINEIYLPLVCRVTYAKIEALKEFIPVYDKVAKELLGENVDISVDYVASGVKLNDFNSLKTESLIYKRALELQSAELAMGSSLVGPHKHDVLILYNGNDSRFYCSQGQQRTLVLAFKIAQILLHKMHFNDYPMLLLDDVFSELDSDKRNRLVELLLTLKTQIFLSSTEANLSENISGFNIIEVK